MITDVLEHIGLWLQTQISEISVIGVNCIKDKDGRVMYEFNKDGEYKGIKDGETLGAYLRFNGNFTYLEQPKYSSCKNANYTLQVPIRLGVYSVSKKYNPYAIEQLLRKELLNINWTGYVGDESNIRIILNAANTDFRQVFSEEFGRDYDRTAPLIYLYIDFTLELKQAMACNEINICLNSCC